LRLGATAIGPLVEIARHFFQIGSGGFDVSRAQADSLAGGKIAFCHDVYLSKGRHGVLKRPRFCAFCCICSQISCAC